MLYNVIYIIEVILFIVYVWLIISMLQNILHFIISYKCTFLNMRVLLK